MQTDVSWLKFFFRERGGGPSWNHNSDFSSPSRETTPITLTFPGSLWICLVLLCHLTPRKCYGFPASIQTSAESSNTVSMMGLVSQRWVNHHLSWCSQVVACKEIYIQSQWRNCLTQGNQREQEESYKQFSSLTSFPTLAGTSIAPPSRRRRFTTNWVFSLGNRIETK